jgi:hypothetical protein
MRGSSVPFLISLAVNGLAYFCGIKQAQLVQVTGAVVMRTQGGLLEVSTITSQERFKHKEPAIRVPFGTTISMIQVPAVFRYHIRWPGMDLRVEAARSLSPPVRPSCLWRLKLASAGLFKRGLGTAHSSVCKPRCRSP